LQTQQLHNAAIGASLDKQPVRASTRLLDNKAALRVAVEVWGAVERELVERALQVLQHGQLVEEHVVEVAAQARQGVLAEVVEAVLRAAVRLAEQVVQCEPDLRGRLQR
jgi:hypothetical protein